MKQKENLYKFIFCFLNKDGSVQRDLYDCEIYYDEDIWAEDEEKAKEKFLEQFIYNGVEPEIVDILEV